MARMNVESRLPLAKSADEGESGLSTPSLAGPCRDCARASDAMNGSQSAERRNSRRRIQFSWSVLPISWDGQYMPVCMGSGEKVLVLDRRFADCPDMARLR